MPPASSRPTYKRHPLWNRAIAVTREAYALAEAIRRRDEEAAAALRRAAVAIPSHVAGALEARGADRAQEALAARGALAEVARRSRGESSSAARRLEGEAAALDARILFDFADADGVFS